MRQKTHAVSLLAVLFSIAASAESACSSDSTPGGPEGVLFQDAGGDRAVGSDAQGQHDSQPASDGAGQSDTASGDAGVDADAADDAPFEDALNPFQDAFETFDAAMDSAITTEGDSSMHFDGAGIQDGAGPPPPDAPMMVGD